MKMEKVKILGQATLYSNIEEEALHDLMEKVHYQVKSYSTGDVVVFSGDACNELQIVLEGSVRGEMMDMSGRVLKIEDITVLIDSEKNYKLSHVDIERIKNKEETDNLFKNFLPYMISYKLVKSGV